VKGIRENDLLFVDNSLITVEGDVVLAEIDGEITGKKIERKNSHLRLVSCNSKLNCTPVEPLYIFHVIGVVIGSFRFRR
jgi:SOS-response transcriptional repressor LexA